MRQGVQRKFWIEGHRSRQRVIISLYMVLQPKHISWFQHLSAFCVDLHTLPLTEYATCENCMSLMSANLQTDINRGKKERCTTIQQIQVYKHTCEQPAEVFCLHHALVLHWHLNQTGEFFRCPMSVWWSNITHNSSNSKCKPDLQRRCHAAPNASRTYRRKCLEV